MCFSPAHAFGRPQEHFHQRFVSVFSSKPTLGVTVWDLFYVGLTIVVFAVLFLILKGIESFER
jgi:hypothetical protein